MANRYFAVVKKDDYATTASTGGIVVGIKYWPENASDRTANPYNLELSFGKSIVSISASGKIFDSNKALYPSKVPISTIL